MNRERPIVNFSLIKHNTSIIKVEFINDEYHIYGDIKNEYYTSNVKIAADLIMNYASNYRSCIANLCNSNEKMLSFDITLTKDIKKVLRMCSGLYVVI